MRDRRGEGCRASRAFASSQESDGPEGACLEIDCGNGDGFHRGDVCDEPERGLGVGDMAHFEESGCTVLFRSGVWKLGDRVDFWEHRLQTASCTQSDVDS